MNTFMHNSMLFEAPQNNVVYFDDFYIPQLQSKLLAILGEKGFVSCSVTVRPCPKFYYVNVRDGNNNMVVQYSHKQLSQAFTGAIKYAKMIVTKKG